MRTKLITKSNTEIPIDYRMQKEGDRWRAYDVVIEGVSLVSNYRTQFNRIIQQSGYSELVNRMKTKQEELEFIDGEDKPAKKPGEKREPTPLVVSDELKSLFPGEPQAVEQPEGQEPQVPVQAADVADADLQQGGGFGLGAFAAQDGVHDFENVSFTLTHLDPVWGLHDGRHDSSLA